MLLSPKNNTDFIHTLITHGADINISDDNLSTPLMHAARNGISNVVKILIKNNAKLDITDKIGNTPLIYCMFNPEFYDDDYAKKILNKEERYEKNNTLFIKSCKADKVVDNIPNKIVIIKEFLKAGVNINAQNNNGDTALMIALRNQKYDLAEVLIKAKADTAIVNNHGESAMSINDNPKITKMLIEKEKTIDYQKKKISTFIEMNNKNSQNEAMQILTSSILKDIQLNLANVSNAESFSQVFNEFANLSANLAGCVDIETQAILEKLAEFSRRAAARFGDQQASSIVENFYEEKKDSVLCPKNTLILSSQDVQSLNDDEKDVVERLRPPKLKY